MAIVDLGTKEFARAGKSGRRCRLLFSLSETELLESWAVSIESREQITK
jgi:hypothetical protein